MRRSSVTTAPRSGLISTFMSIILCHMTASRSSCCNVQENLLRKMADMDFLIAAREEALKAGNWPRFNAATRLIVEKENETELQVFPAGLQWVAPFVGGQKKLVRLENSFLSRPHSQPPPKPIRGT